MSAKKILSDDEIQNLFKVYAEKRTYAATARATGINVDVVRRVVKEFLSFFHTNAPYEGPQPAEFPDQNLVVNFYNPGKEWKESYEMDLLS